MGSPTEHVMLGSVFSLHELLKSGSNHLDMAIEAKIGLYRKHPWRIRGREGADLFILLQT